MTIDDIKELISKGETRTLELKKTTGELKDGMHTLCAFLNTDGGILVFGIAPTSLKIEGQTVSDKTRQEIALEMRKIEPFVNIPIEYIDVPDGKGKQLIAIVADRHLYFEAPYVFDGKPYYKSESTTMPMPQTMYEQMLRHRDSETFRWDSLVAKDFSISDLDEELIRNVVRMSIANGRLFGSAESEPLESLLGKLKLLKEGKPTNAAVVLFAKDTELYPQIELRMACFKGTDKNIFIDNKSESGNFFHLLDAGVAFCFRNLKLSGEIVGLQREDKLEIPIEALREALINALCQRNKETQVPTDKQAVIDIIGGKLAVFGGKLAVSSSTIGKLADVYLFVKNNPNCNSEKVASMLSRGKSTAKNYLHILAELEMIKPQGTFKDRTYSV